MATFGFQLPVTDESPQLARCCQACLPTKSAAIAQTMHSRWHSLAMATVGFLKITQAQRPVMSALLIER